jgi:two-component system alkaline phosphatase synthesis response regulator PhoP/two-component system response regulator VicR
MTAPAENRKLLRVLVADDERHVARLVQVNLERLGHTVELAHDGLEARDKALQGGYDLLVLDVMMPHMDGVEVLRTLRKDPRTKNLKIVILTVKAQDEDILRGFENGADYYLTKPFNPDEVARLIDEIVM